MTVTNEEIAAVLGALRVLDREKLPPDTDRWILAARLGRESDPWLAPGDKLTPSFIPN